MSGRRPCLLGTGGADVVDIGVRLVRLEPGLQGAESPQSGAWNEGVDLVRDEPVQTQIEQQIGPPSVVDRVGEYP